MTTVTKAMLEAFKATFYNAKLSKDEAIEASYLAMLSARAAPLAIQQASQPVEQPTSTAESGTPRTDSLWGRLMDACKASGIAPANADPVFGLLKDFRSLEKEVIALKAELTEAEQSSDYYEKARNSANQAIVELQHKLASAQADLVKMRGALENSIQAMSDVNNTGTITLDDDIAVAAEALAAPPDRSALDAMLVAAKVEVLEHAIEQLFVMYLPNESDKWMRGKCCESLRRLADQLAAGTQKGDEG